MLKASIFAMAAFLRWGLPAWVAVIGSAALFGMAHLYQGRSGLAGTTILGLLFGATRVVVASLIPVMFWHAGVDVVAGIVGFKYMTGKVDSVE